MEAIEQERQARRMTQLPPDLAAAVEKIKKGAERWFWPKSDERMVLFSELDKLAAAVAPMLEERDAEIASLRAGRSKERDRITAEITALRAELARYQWQPIGVAPRDGTRINLGWKAVQGLSKHVELGRFSASSGWCNTYGKPFSGEPDYWAPLPEAPRS